MTRAGRSLISFACNDYLALAHHPEVIAAAQAALALHGAGAGGSRLVVGDAPELGALEAALAQAKGTEAALVFSSGYLANLGVVPALAGRGDVVLLDKLSPRLPVGWGAAVRRRGGGVRPQRRRRSRPSPRPPAPRRPPRPWC